MRISPKYLIRIIEVRDHGFPFGFAVVIDDRFFLVFALQVHRHPRRISLRMELRSDHVFIKTNTHDRSFQWNMRTFFFNAKNFCFKLTYALKIGLNNLEIPAINRKKRIR